MRDIQERFIMRFVDTKTGWRYAIIAGLIIKEMYLHSSIFFTVLVLYHMKNAQPIVTTRKMLIISIHKVKLTCSPSILFGLFVFWIFQGCTCSIKKFPGQGSNQSYSCQPTSQPQQYQIRAASVTYTTAHRILNPLRKVRDGTHILMDTSQIHFH